MKQLKVMERVYEPGRLNKALQQVKEECWGSRNRQKCFSMILRRQLSNHELIVDRRSAYLVSTSRFVGRGWSTRLLPTRFAGQDATTPGIMGAMMGEILVLPQRLIFVFSASSDRMINVFHKARKSYIFIVQRVLPEIRTFQKLKNSVSYYRNLITEKVEVCLTNITNPKLFG